MQIGCRAPRLVNPEARPQHVADEPIRYLSTVWCLMNDSELCARPRCSRSADRLTARLASRTRSSRRLPIRAASRAASSTAREIVQAIKRVEADRLSDQAETLVYHAARGKVWEALAVAAGIAGRRAASRSAYLEAAVSPAEACEQLPRSEDTLAHEIDLRFDPRSSLSDCRNR
jgi:hypothetical protein